MNNKKYDENKAKEENIMNEIKTTINNTNEDNVNKINCIYLPLLYFATMQKKLEDY